MTVEIAWIRRTAASLLLAGICVLVMPHAPGGSAAAGQPQAPAQQDEFLPLDSLPPDEQLPAAPLVATAYAAAWLVILGYLWSIWRRLGRVEREMADVARRVEGGRRAAPEPRSGGGG